jgi:transposase InsO family protein
MLQDRQTSLGHPEQLLLGHGVSSLVGDPKCEPSPSVPDGHLALDGVVIDDAKVFNDKLREWEDFYNYHRPHGALAGQTPYERLKQRTQAQV